MAYDLELKKKEILKLVFEYISNDMKNKKWKRGEDWVSYSGPTFDEKEYLSAIETILGGWMIFGENAREFEK
ncbi:MAG TPA: hypothetical protein EYG21_08360, partial [Nitrospinaceae bacterium]|nr:hypothetical protein [Nitrospinaceae bacterium]